MATPRSLACKRWLAHKTQVIHPRLPGVVPHHLAVDQYRLQWTNQIFLRVVLDVPEQQPLGIFTVAGTGEVLLDELQRQLTCIDMPLGISERLFINRIVSKNRNYHTIRFS